MKRKKSEDSVPAMQFLTLTSFSDIMALCLTFFVLLFMLSEPKKPKLEATMRAFMQQLGVMPAQRSPVPTFIPPTRVTQDQASTLRRGPPGRQPDVRRLVEDNRQKIVLGGDALFRPGGTELSAQGQRILQVDVAPDLKGFRNRIEIRGHTDAATPEEQRDSWSLGFARAASVMRFLVDVCGLDESRFRLISSGDKEPVDPANPAANRRVEILMTELEARAPGVER